MSFFTPADHELDGGPECQECVAEQDDESLESGICWNCGEVSGHHYGDGPDPDDIRDRQREDALDEAAGRFD